MSEERETRLLMISPASRITPEMLARTIHAMGVDVALKETCYGCLIEGTVENSILFRGVKVGKNTVITGKTSVEDYTDGRLESGKCLMKAGDQV